MPEEIVVWLECPGCQYLWVAAIIRPGAWYTAGTTPATIADRCYCPKCEQCPPMRLVDSGVIVRRDGLDR